MATRKDNGMVKWNEIKPDITNQQYMDRRKWDSLLREQGSSLRTWCKQSQVYGVLHLSCTFDANGMIDDLKLELSSKHSFGAGEGYFHLGTIGRCHCGRSCCLHPKAAPSTIDASTALENALKYARSLQPYRS